MKNLISMGTLVFITFAVAVFALVNGVFNAITLRNIQPQVTVITKEVATQSAVTETVEASPSAKPVKPVVKKVVPSVSVSQTVAK